MPKIKYQTKRLSPERKAIIAQAETIINEYKAQGYTLTLRQVYYQFVRRDWFPQAWADPATGSTNNENSYKKLGDIISDGRMCGMLDWEAIEDRTREVDGTAHWDTPAAIIEGAAAAFHIDKWVGQPTRVEVWVEKDALENVVSRAARSRDVQYFSCRGYASMSSIWEAARRLKGYVEDGQKVVILHLGDHDPSGIDMSRDIFERLNMFVYQDIFDDLYLGDGQVCEDDDEDEGGQTKEDKLYIVQEKMFELCGSDKITVKRIALTRAQVNQYNPPPNPAKVTDSRYTKYVAEHGQHCWELDALEPAVLDALIRAEIDNQMEADKFNALLDKENTHREHLSKASAHWNNGLSDYISKLK